jgi:hypothetical protein
VGQPSRLSTCCVRFETWRCGARLGGRPHGRPRATSLVSRRCLDKEVSTVCLYEVEKRALRCFGACGDPPVRLLGR